MSRVDYIVHDAAHARDRMLAVQAAEQVPVRFPGSSFTEPPAADPDDAGYPAIYCDYRIEYRRVAFVTAGDVAAGIPRLRELAVLCLVWLQRGSGDSRALEVLGTIADAFGPSHNVSDHGVAGAELTHREILPDFPVGEKGPFEAYQTTVTIQVVHS